MANTCTNVGNTGTISCPFLMKIIARVVLVPKYGATGAVNKIATGDLTKATLQALFDNSEKMSRFYPTPLLKNVTNERADPEYFEYDGGGKDFVREGVRNFTGVIPKKSTELAGRLNQWNGQEMGFYAFDSDGNFIYKQGSDGDYLPIAIDGGSFYTGFKWANNSDPSMLAVAFDVLQTEKDSDIRYVPAANLDFDGLDGADVYGLSEVVVDITTATATGGTVEFALDMGSPLSGLLVGDIVATNVTNNTTITVSSLTESGTNTGTYAFVYATGIAAGETLKIQVSKTRLSHTYGTLVVS